MSAFDEQNDEMEVLSSIFPTEIEILSAKPHKFRIQISPNPGGEENHVTAVLVCTFPDDYPTSSAPIIDIVVTKGLSLDRGEELKAIAESVATENIGLPSVFTIAEAVKDWLIDNNVAGQDGSMYSDMLRREQQKEVESKKQTAKAAMKALADSEFKDLSVDPEELERIRKRQAGTQVTMESFIKWKTEFNEEMRLKALAEAAKSGVSSSSVVEDKLTGKQFFLQNKALVDDEEALILAGESEEIPEEVDAKGTILDYDDAEYDEEEDEDYVDEGGDNDD